MTEGCGGEGHVRRAPSASSVRLLPLAIRQHCALPSPNLALCALCFKVPLTHLNIKPLLQQVADREGGREANRQAMRTGQNVPRAGNKQRALTQKSSGLHINRNAQP